MDTYDYAIVGGGPTGLTLAWILCSNNKKVVLIEKENSFGGCHRVQRVDGFFSEHGPRVYSNSYLMFKEILSDMNLNFDDLFTEYKVNLDNIDNKTILSLNFNEKYAFVIAFLTTLINIDYGKNISINKFMYDNNFTEETIDYIGRLCRLTDGASADDYTLFQFIQLANQQIFYKLYQPKVPNDKGLIKNWVEKINETKNITFYLNASVDKILLDNNKVSQLIIIKDNKQMIIRATKFILAIPPKHLYKLLNYSPGLKNAFGDLENWKEKNSYFDYIPLTFHYYNKTELPKLNGFPRTPWGIGFIILSDSMIFDKTEPSKTVISITITMTNIPNEHGKTVNQCSKEEIIEYVKEQLSFFPTPDKIIISPNVVRQAEEWINLDTAYVVTSEGTFLNYNSKFDNLFAVGIYNGNSTYHFTALESSVQNAIEFSKNEIPELKYKYKLKHVTELKDIFYIVLIIIVSLLIIYAIKQYNQTR